MQLHRETFQAGISSSFHMRGISRDTYTPPAWLGHRALLLALALAVIGAIALGSAYAAFDRRIELPIRATVTVNALLAPGAADVNDDGVVDEADLLIVAQDLNSDHPADPRADVDGNGRMNVADLAFVARYLGSPADVA